MNATVKEIERTPVRGTAWAAAVAGVLFVRFLLENFSSRPLSGYLASDMPTLVHYLLFYVSLALALVLLLSRFSGKPVDVLMRLAPYALVVTWLPPLADLFLSGGKGIGMAYLFQPPAPLVACFLTFFGPLVAPGITPGMRIEILAVLVAVLAYVREATGRPGRAIAAAAATYAAIFVWVSMPSVAYALGAGTAFAHMPNPVSAFFRASVLSSQTLAGFLHPSLAPGGAGFETRFDVAMAQIFFLLAAALFAAVAAVSNRRRFLAVLRNSRPERVAHYFLMFGLGLLVARAGGARLTSWTDVAATATVLASIYFAWMFAVGINDLADVEIDRVSNPSRPLVRGSVSADETGRWNLFFLVSSLLGAWLGGSHVFFLMLVFTAAYYVYSAPPLRLKRVPGIATFLISLACLSSAMAGFFLVSPGAQLGLFPARIAALIIVVFTLAANVKDVKDVAGDAREGILTVPTMLGERRGASAVGALLCVSFWAVPLFLGGAAIYLTSFPAGIAGYVIVTRRPYRESRVFILYFVYALVSLALLSL